MPGQHSRFAGLGGGNLFLLALFATIVLAQIFPGPGARGGWLKPEVTNRSLVALVFVVHGMMLSFDALGAGVLRWRLHLVAQACTFLVFPLVGWAAVDVADHHLGAELSAGFLYLCALPSTLSSSVALTATARGNVAGSVFSASLSSVLGVFLTPLWVGLLLHTRGEALPVAAAVQDLLLWLLLPLGAGQALRRWVGKGVERFRSLSSGLDRAIVLFLVYTSMADSVHSGVFRVHGPTKFGGIVLLCAGLLVLLKGSSWLLGGWIVTSREDRISAFFCGSQKTLAAGVPMAHVIFGTSPALGPLLLPILVYHPLQLIAGAWFAERFRRAS